MMRFTKAFIWVMLTFIIGVDIILAARGGPGATISEVTKAYSWNWHTIPIAYGILTGHLFWNARGEVKWRAARYAGLAVIAVASVVVDVGGWLMVMPIIPLVPAVGLGRLLWPQSVLAEQPLLMRK